MKLLLDTVTFIWLTQTPQRLSEDVAALCADATNTLYLSVLSVAETALKYERQRLYLPSPPSQFIPEERREHHILSLPLDELSCVRMAHLPRIHRDPFDRLLICQAIEHNLIILTPDAHIRQYNVETLW